MSANVALDGTKITRHMRYSTLKGERMEIKVNLDK